MEIHFLGTTGYHPNETRHTMCVMIPELGIVLDAGSAMFRVRDRIQTPELTILLSHAHLDHVLGLTFLLDILHGKECQATVVGQREKLTAIQHHLFSQFLFPVSPPYQSKSLESIVQMGDTWEIRPGVMCCWFPVQHPGGAVGFRLDWADGRSLAYVTDTTAAGDVAYQTHIQDVDLLIHECYFPDGLEEMASRSGHSCLTEVVQLADRVNARRLALVHLNPLSEWAPRLDSLPRDRQGPSILIPEDSQVLTLD